MFQSQTSSFYIISNFGSGCSWLKVMEDNLRSTFFRSPCIYIYIAVFDAQDPEFLVFIALNRFFERNGSTFFSIQYLYSIHLFLIQYTDYLQLFIHRFFCC